jgi:hypothetical protein
MFNNQTDVSKAFMHPYEKLIRWRKCIQSRLRAGLLFPTFITSIIFYYGLGGFLATGGWRRERLCNRAT